MPSTLFLILLNLFLIPDSTGMFAPAKPKKHCVDVKAYFAMSGENSYEEDEDSFFYVDRSEMTSSSKDTQIQKTSSLDQKSVASSGVSQSSLKSSQSQNQNQNSVAASGSQNSQKTSKTLKESESNLKSSSAITAHIDKSIKDQKTAIEKAHKDTKEFIGKTGSIETSESASLDQKASQKTSSLDQKSVASSGVSLSSLKSSQSQNQNTLQKSSGLQGICSNVTGNCQDGWRSFQRPSGEWCMKIFYETSIIQANAEKRCQAQGAVLSGLQNQIESQYVFSTVTAQIYPDTGSIWIGLKRRSDCLTVGQYGNCTAMNSFQWTDKSASGTEGLAWACGQPDNARGRTQHCVTLTASGSGDVMGFQTGLMDDVGCDFDYIKQNRKPRDIKAYVCGKKP